MRVARCYAAFVMTAVICLLLCVPAMASTLDPVDSDSYEWVFDKKDGWQCFDDDGEPVTGWVLRDDDTYYLDKDGFVKTGWIKYKGSWYYLDEETGILARNTWIDNYKVDKDGVCIKIK